MFNPNLEISADNFNTDLMEVKTNPDLVFCFDDVIDSDTLLKISQYDWRARQWAGGWRINGIIGNPAEVTPTDLILNPEITEKFKKLDSIKFPFVQIGITKTIDCLLNLDPNFKIIDHVGSYWTIQDEKMDNVDQVHRDFYEFKPCWSMIFHFLGDSGPTEFYHSFYDSEPYRKIDFKPGRAILFPSVYPHRAGVPNRTLRICHSVRLIIKSKLNNDILKNSPNLQKYDYIN
jgi:hypothetical protein